jgi:hypothetical protein
MDEKGFIFTADASLALVVIIVFAASVLVYSLLPIYQGQDHQHLEMLAESALASMEQNGTFDYVASLYAANKTEEADGILNDTLNSLIPANEGIGYKMTFDTRVVTNESGQRFHPLRTDVVTRVKVISAPQEGWKARAYYKVEEVKFNDVNQTTITTVWNFHNYLAGHFTPWYSDGTGTYGGNGKLVNHNYWAGSNNPPSGSNSPAQTSQNINFNIPATGPISSVKYLVGCLNDSYTGTEPAYSLDFVLGNSNHHYVPSSNFTYLYTRSGDAGKVYNYMGNLASGEFSSGVNNFYVKYFNASHVVRSESGSYVDYYSDMPWFSIIANYTTTLKVPEGIISTNSYFDDIGGVGRPSSQGTCLNYSLNTGTVTAFPGRTTTWTYLSTRDFNTVFPGTGDSYPFELTGMTGITYASAVASETDLYLPPGNNLLDSYLVVNSYGAADGVIVQVKPEGGSWQTVFTSFGTTYTQNVDGANGYGNIPGIIALHDTYNPSKQYLRSGHNTVRVITYDIADGRDYDLVGLTNSYAVISYSPLSIGWDTVTFDSYQNRSTTSSAKKFTQTKNFTIKDDAQSALLFLGTGLDTRTVTVTLSQGATSSVLYSGSGLYSMDLGEYDLNHTPHIITAGSVNGTPVLKPGKYNVTVNVVPSFGYESGDYSGASGAIAYTNYADPEIFSGTRISVIYPKFLQNMWSMGFANTADGAKYSANQSLQKNLTDTGIKNFNYNNFKYEVIYTGDVPSATPVRLELWKQ